MEHFTRRFQHKKVQYKAVFSRRPFREGLEVTVVVGESTIRVAELGLGEKALLLKVKSIIDSGNF